MSVRRRWTVGLLAAALAGAALYAVARPGTHSVPGPVNEQAVSAAAAKLAGECDETNLLSCLEKQPADVSPDPGSWAAITEPSAQQFAAHYFDPSATAETVAVQNLTKAGLQRIAHERWITSGSADAGVDVVVMRFSSAQGALARSLGYQGDALGTAVSDGVERALPGLPGFAYPAAAPDADGYYRTQYITAFGNLLMFVDVVGRDSVDEAELATWARGEYLTLRTAQVPAEPAARVATATARCAPLTACLMAAPAGGTPWTTGWAGEQAPTALQFAQQMYPAAHVQRAADILRTQGLTGIANRTWALPDGTLGNAVLLGFSTTQGAESRTRQEISGSQGTKFAVPGAGSATGFLDTTADAQGYEHATVFGRVGDIAVELHTAAPGGDQAQAASWAQTQLAKLAAVTTTGTAAQAPLAAPTTTPAAPAGTAACADPVSCLLPMPNGAAPGSSDTWDNTNTVTVAQYVADKWGTESAADQAYESSLLTKAGVVRIVHREWMAADGDQADMDVLVFANVGQAAAHSLDYQGAMLGGSQAFPVPGEPGAEGALHPGVDDLGNVHAELDGHTGRFEVHLDYYSPGTFAGNEAAGWFDTQLSLL